MAKPSPSAPNSGITARMIAAMAESSRGSMGRIRKGVVMSSVWSGHSNAHPGAGHAAGGGLAQLFRQPVTGFDQLVEIDAGLDAHALQHVGNVLAGHVAGRALGVRTAAGARHR